MHPGTVDEPLDLRSIYAGVSAFVTSTGARKPPPPPATPKHWPPNYQQTLEWRIYQLGQFAANPLLIDQAKRYYAKHPVEFINHWLSTYDPRKAARGLPTKMPFILFQRQVELVEFLQACLQDEANGLVEKARDMGATWVCCCFSVWLWLFHPGVAVGWGSRKAQQVDRLGDPSSIFEKIRMTILDLPSVFQPKGFDRESQLLHMRVINPENGSVITGEAGDNIGRGGRTLIYFKDEAAHYEHPEQIEGALSDNTRVQVDISSVGPLGNVFNRKRESGVEWVKGTGKLDRAKTQVFVMDVFDHPEKTRQWYDERKLKAESDGLKHVFAREVDRNYAASVLGVIIQQEWVHSAIDAHVKLKLEPSGPHVAGLDVADSGLDRNALILRQGFMVKECDEWSAQDTGETTRRALAFARKYLPCELQYDAVGVGAGVKAESNRLNADGLMPRGLKMVPWFAGAKVLNPHGRIIEGDKRDESPKNKDFYANLKAQAWWSVRHRFELTHRCVAGEIEVTDADELISLPSNLPVLRSLMKELCQAVAGQSSAMKMIVDKAPEGTKSPNLADALVMAFFPWREWREITAALSAPRILEG